MATSRPTDEETVREHFNSSAASYSENWRGDIPLARFYHDRKDIVLKMLNDAEPTRLLEVGCGPGMMVDALLRRGFNYTGADLSEGMISECHKTFENVEGTRFEAASIVRLPFADEEFSVVLCLGALEYVKELDRAFQEVSRVLAPGGSFVFSMLNRRSPYRLCERIYRHGLFPCKHFTERFANRLLARHGFYRLECVYFDFNVVPPPIDMRFSGVSLRLRSAIECSCPRFLKRWLGTGFLIASRCSGS